MIYGSVCSGIESATVAWEPIGWKAAFYSEIDAAPCALLKHYYPTVPNHGDMTLFKAWPDAALDLLVGGTPCQSFSVAGLRKGLDDPRGNLTLTYLAVADKYRPAWLVWENVPGVLSDDGGRTFGTFLGGLAKLGYGFAYRVLDAQYIRVESHARAVPQRRRRVFVVGCSRGWQRAAAVLFERESLCGHPPPRRESGKVAPTLSSRRSGGGGLGGDFDYDGGLVASTGDVSHCLNAGGMGRQDYETETLVSHALRADGFDASEDGTGRGTPIIAIQDEATRGNPQSGPGGKGWNDSGAAYTHQADHVQAVAFHNRQDPDVSGAVTHPLGAKDNGLAIAELAPTLRAMPNQGPGRMADDAATMNMVRRLTPRECDRLQGFRDDYTLIPYRGKLMADGPRYKMLGNSMAVNVMRWIGERIQAVEGLR